MNSYDLGGFRIATIFVAGSRVIKVLPTVVAKTAIIPNLEVNGDSLLIPNQYRRCTAKKMPYRTLFFHLIGFGMISQEGLEILYSDNSLTGTGNDFVMILAPQLLAKTERFLIFKGNTPRGELVSFFYDPRSFTLRVSGS